MVDHTPAWEEATMDTQAPLVPAKTAAWAAPAAAGKGHGHGAATATKSVALEAVSLD